MKIRKGLLGIVGIFLMVLMISCEKNSTVKSEGKLKNSGKVILTITDAPFPSDLVAEANITVDWVKLYLSTEINDEKGTDSVGFYSIDLTEDSTFNLLDLSNGLTAFLGEAEVPAGEYDEIRMHILDAEVIMMDGEVYDLKVPSGSSSGLKIKINPHLFMEENGEMEVLLDFDVSHSFVVKGNYNSKTGKNNIKGFNFKPVLRAVPQVISGQIAGVVADTTGVLLNNALISLLSGPDTITTALTTGEGYYGIIGIPEGTYSVGCSIDGFIGQLAENIDVVAGEMTEQHFSMVPENIESEE